jgi:1,4-alpha-glucan branching enzyme
MGAELGQWNEWHFEYSLDWHLLQYEPHRQTQEFFKAMNALYLQQPPLWDQDDSWKGFQWLSADDAQANTVAFLRWDSTGKPLVVVCNFSPVHRKGYRVGLPFAGTWAPILNTDDARFGGQGLGDTAPIKSENVPCHEQAQSMVIDLPPMSAMIYRCTRKSPVRKSKDDAAKTAKAEKAEKPAKAKKAEKADKPLKADTAVKAKSKAEKAEKTEQTEKPAKRASRAKTKKA